MFWKASVLGNTEGNKDFPLLKNWRLFKENLQFYVTKNQNRRKTEQKEIKGPVFEYIRNTDQGWVIIIINVALYWRYKISHLIKLNNRYLLYLSVKWHRLGNLDEFL